MTATTIPTWVRRITTGHDTFQGQHTIAVIGWGDDGRSAILSTMQLPAPKGEKSMIDLFVDGPERPMSFVYGDAPKPPAFFKPVIVDEFGWSYGRWGRKP